MYFDVIWEESFSICAATSGAGNIARSRTISWLGIPHFLDCIITIMTANSLHIPPLYGRKYQSVRRNAAKLSFLYTNSFCEMQVKYVRFAFTFVYVYTYVDCSPAFRKWSTVLFSACNISGVNLIDETNLTRAAEMEDASRRKSRKCVTCIEQFD